MPSGRSRCRPAWKSWIRLIPIAPEVDANDIVVPPGDEAIDRSAGHDRVLLQRLSLIVAAGPEKSAEALLARELSVILLRRPRLTVELPQRIHDGVETDRRAGADPQVRRGLNGTGVRCP